MLVHALFTHSKIIISKDEISPPLRSRSFLTLLFATKKRLKITSKPVLSP